MAKVCSHHTCTTKDDKSNVYQMPKIRQFSEDKYHFSSEYEGILPYTSKCKKPFLCSVHMAGKLSWFRKKLIWQQASGTIFYTITTCSSRHLVWICSLVQYILVTISFCYHLVCGRLYTSCTNFNFNWMVKYTHCRQASPLSLAVSNGTLEHTFSYWVM